MYPSVFSRELEKTVTVRRLLRRALRGRRLAVSGGLGCYGRSWRVFIGCGAVQLVGANLWAPTRNVRVLAGVVLST